MVLILTKKIAREVLTSRMVDISKQILIYNFFLCMLAWCICCIHNFKIALLRRVLSTCYVIGQRSLNNYVWRSLIGVIALLEPFWLP